MQKLKNSVSIICCYNNFEAFNNYLIRSLKRQVNQSYEVIGVNNAQNEFKSCAEALNWGVQRAKYEHIVCVHQDFEFIDSNCLNKIINCFKVADSYDVFGPAGAIYDPNVKFYKYLVCRSRKCIDSLGPEFNEDLLELEEKIPVETLDECCICFNKILWEKHHFSQDLCPFWDLYGVEICLYTRCYLNGSVYVLPFKANHHSGGKLTSKFYIALYKILNAYKSKISRITTTCVSASTSMIYFKCIWLRFSNYFRKN